LNIKIKVMFSKICLDVFEKSVLNYHVKDSVNQAISNPFEKDKIEHLLYHKNWIDTVQWHLEDLIRDPEIDPTEALKLKRTIDSSNQKRTDLVEYIDSFFLDTYKSISPKKEATLNSETPAWAIDRLSILSLKIFHMNEEANRIGANQNHLEDCARKLNILKEQNLDLCTSIDELISDIESGNKYMKTYKQMKMYNDEDLNPVLYNLKK
jgi:hypothetical protein